MRFATKHLQNFTKGVQIKGTKGNMEAYVCNKHMAQIHGRIAVLVDLVITS